MDYNFSFHSVYSALSQFHSTGRTEKYNNNDYSELIFGLVKEEADCDHFGYSTHERKGRTMYKTQFLALIDLLKHRKHKHGFGVQHMKCIYTYQPVDTIWDKFYETGKSKECLSNRPQCQVFDLKYMTWLHVDYIGGKRTDQTCLTSDRVRNRWVCERKPITCTATDGTGN